MEFIKTIPEHDEEIIFENLNINKYGDIKIVYTKNNIRKSKTINISELSDDSKQKYSDVCYDNILHQLDVNITQFEFETKEEL